mmetsp:Transcript_14365/g.31444  ORF Transcript_14365/g.31444 Transcript_14365/m.31444 type:complete len:112 (-) Transcript_14365:282-617(-)
MIELVPAVGVKNSRPVKLERPLIGFDGNGHGLHQQRLHQRGRRLRIDVLETRDLGSLDVLAAVVKESLLAGSLRGRVRIFLLRTQPSANVIVPERVVHPETAQNTKHKKRA